MAGRYGRAETDRLHGTPRTGRGVQAQFPKLAQTSPVDPFPRAWVAATAWPSLVAHPTGRGAYPPRDGDARRDGTDGPGPVWCRRDDRKHRNFGTNAPLAAGRPRFLPAARSVGDGAPNGG